MTSVRKLRWVAFFEGISFLVLLFIAMPLKYAFERPSAVRVTGALHGILFLLFILALYTAQSEQKWPLKRTLFGFVCSLLPFGTFYLDRALKAEEEEFARKAALASAREV